MRNITYRKGKKKIKVPYNNCQKNIWFNKKIKRCCNIIRIDEEKCRLCKAKGIVQTLFPSKFNSDIILDITL